MNLANWYVNLLMPIERIISIYVSCGCEAKRLNEICRPLIFSSMLSVFYAARSISWTDYEATGSMNLASWCTVCGRRTTLASSLFNV